MYSSENKIYKVILMKISTIYFYEYFMSCHVILLLVDWTRHYTHHQLYLASLVKKDRHCIT